MKSLWNRLAAFCRRVGGLQFTVGGVLKALLITAVSLFGLVVLLTLVAVYYPRHPLPKSEPVDDIVYLDQGWAPGRDSKDRETYYYTPQGTSIKDLRYSWLVNLEQAQNRKRFADPDHMRDFGFLVDLAPTARNPYQLPVGFTRHYDPEAQDDVLDLTCAACHTGQFNVKHDGKTIGVRIDGGEARHAFTAMEPGHFLPELIVSLGVTWLDPFTFDRFAKNVLGAEHYKQGKDKLHKDLGHVIALFVKQGWNDKTKHLYPVDEGFGRTDAIGRIANTVFGDHIEEANYRTGDAPVSYPPVWDIWKFDWVQYGASVRHPLARNVGEAMGVGAKYAFFDDYGRAVPPDQRYRASTMIDKLMDIEGTLQKLGPPRWPEDLLGPIDCEKANQGRMLFAQHCVGCHGPHEGSDAMKAWDAPGKLSRSARMVRNDETFGLAHLSDPSKLYHWTITTLPVEIIGTDPKAAQNFVNNRMDLSKTGITSDELRALLKPLYREDLERRIQGISKPDEKQKARAAGEAKIAEALNKIDARSVSTGAGLNFFGLYIRAQYRADARFMAAEHGETYTDVEGADDDLFFGEIDLPQTPLAYKARPLAGMWATAPYLHNGSVPNLYQLLGPADRRDKRFFVGRKEYDPVKVGYALQPLSSTGFWLDTSIPGNSNKGHEFRSDYTGRPQNGVIGPELTDEQRYAIIEYLKVRQDTPGREEMPSHCQVKPSGRSAD